MRKGFSLLEVLLAIIIIAILVSAGLPIYRMIQARSDADSAFYAIVESLRRAEQLAAAPEGDASWGVKIATSTVTLFRGVSFFGRDVNFDEVYDVSDYIVYGGLNEIVFSRYLAAPTATGTIFVALPNGESRTININTKGTLDY